MNYYERHIGDYLKDTAHLSLLEHGIYTRLLDVYYTRETALPAASIARLIGARSKEELAALAVVLGEFFVADESGDWSQARCEKEIALYQKKVTHNRTVGKLGGRPKKTETQQKPTGLFLGSETEPERNPLQSPDTRHQTPDTKGQEKPTAPASPWLTVESLTADGLSAEVASAWIAHRQTRKAKLTALAWQGFKAEAGKAGWELEAAVLKAIARNWTAFEAGWVAKDGTRATQQPMTPDAKAARDAEARRLLGFDSREVIDV